jgi:ADP-ribosyl-[dinitrogen reductase] hydrolase
VFKKLLQQIQDETDFEFYMCCSVLIGCFLGDAMGSYCEFSDKDERNFTLVWQGKTPTFMTGKGQITDDSELALSLSYAILESDSIHKEIYTDNICFYYMIWSYSNPFDQGTNTRNVMECIREQIYNLDENSKPLSEIIAPFIKEKNKNSKSNGFLMRISPLIIWFYLCFKDQLNFSNPHDNSHYEILILIKQKIKCDVHLSHPNTESLIIASLYTFMILNILYINKVKIQPEASQTVFRNVKLLVHNILFENFNTNEEIKIYKFILQLFMEVPKWDLEEFDVYSNSGHYLHAFKLCLFFLYFFNKFSQNELSEMDCYTNIMKEVCNLGGDTDTNCCIVGGVIGPLVGVSSICKEYVRDLVLFSPVESETDRNRPFLYSPGIIIAWVRKVRELINQSRKNEFYNNKDTFKEKRGNVLFRNKNDEFFNLMGSLNSSI